MSRNINPAQVQKILEFLAPTELDTLVDHLSIVFEMAAFETVTEIQGNEKMALSSQYRLIELLRSIS